MDEELDEIVSVPFDEDDIDESNQVYRTYKMDFERKRIGGMIDGKEAVVQAIWKILSTTRFAHLIYDDQYGCDFFNKINDSGLTDDFLESDMPVMLNIINLRLDITHLYYPAKNSFQKGRLKRREIFTELLLYTLTT